MHSTFMDEAPIFRLWFDLPTNSYFLQQTSAINLIKSPIMHFKTKHIQIFLHLIQDHIERDDISLKFIQIDFQLTNIFTKPLDEKQLVFI